MDLIKRSHKLALVACLSLALFLSFGQGVFTYAEKWEDPKDIVFAVTSEEMFGMSAEMYQPLIDHIKNVTGKPVSFYMTTSYAAEVEAMMRGFVHFARLAPATYIIAHDKDPNIEVVAVHSTPKGVVQRGGVGYYGCLITKKGSGLTSIPQLRGKTLALTDPASTSGCLVPKVFFPDDKLGGEPLDKYFGKIIWTGRHDASMLAVQEGRVDSAFTNGANMERGIVAGVVKKEWFNFLWWSPVIPRDPWCWRKTLKPELREKIREALFTLEPGKAKGAEKFWKDLAAIKFVETHDDVYDSVRKLLEAKKKLKR
jgi:phosphonate transport system substrate-binding protein